MSFISALGGGSATQGAYQLVQSLTGASQTPTTAASALSDVTSAAGSALASAGAHKGRHGHGGGSLLNQIQTAVTSALQTAKASGAAADPNSVVESAIAQVLRNNAAGIPNPTSTTSSTPEGSVSDVTSFFATLQSMGVGPKAFQNDFLAAVNDVQNGQATPVPAQSGGTLGALLDTIG